MTARVLVVDDLLPNLKLLEAKLTSEYFQVSVASSGDEALALLQSEPPDIVLLDVMMPGMDGFEVCHRIKSDPKTTHIPVVMVTALSETADRVRGLEAGADDFLTKPVDDRALFARVRSLVRLKMTIDEWRLREQTSEHFGVMEGSLGLIDESAKEANVLIVEDREIYARRFAEILSVEGHDCVTAATIEGAIEQLRSREFDLAIVDLKLRDEDALMFCSQVRSSDDLRNLPLLVIAEESEVSQLATAMDLGCNDYVVRPVDRNELLARCRTQIRRHRYQIRLRDNYEKSLQLALTDSLTGLYNRRYLEAHLSGLMDRIAGGRRYLSVMMLDIDYFKNINDTHGHAAGDDVLRELCERVMANVRSFDTVARYGGEEFVVVMPETDIAVASAVAERLRHNIADLPFKSAAADTQFKVTISIGVAEVDMDGDSTDALLRRADEALYGAKGAGRNQVMIWEKDGLRPVETSVTDAVAQL